MRNTHKCDISRRGLVVVLFFSMILAVFPIYGDTAPSSDDAASKSANEQKKTGKTTKAGSHSSKQNATSAKKEGSGKKASADQDDDMAPYSDYQDTEGESESYGWLVFKTVFVLALLIGGFYYFFRFVTKKAGVQVLGKDVVQILSVVPIGQNKFLQVVDLAGRILVLGVSENNINVITEVKDKDEIDRIRILSSRSMGGGQAGFQDFLTKQLGKIFNRESSAEAVSPRQTAGTAIGEETDRLSYLKRQRDRLRRMNGGDTDV